MHTMQDLYLTSLGDVDAIETRSPISIFYVCVITQH